MRVTKTKLHHEQVEEALDEVLKLTGYARKHHVHVAQKVRATLQQLAAGCGADLADLKEKERNLAWGQGK